MPQVTIAERVLIRLKSRMARPGSSSCGGAVASGPAKAPAIGRMEGVSVGLDAHVHEVHAGETLGAMLLELVPSGLRGALADVMAVATPQRVGLAAVAGSVVVWALIRSESFELSQKPLDYRARLLRNPKNTLEEVLRVAAPAKGLSVLDSGTSLWRLNEGELRARVQELTEGSDVNARVARLHEELLAAADGPAVNREAAAKVAVSVFMSEWDALASSSERGRALAERMGFEANPDWQAVAEFDAAAAAAAAAAAGAPASSASPGTPAALLRDWEAVRPFAATDGGSPGGRRGVGERAEIGDDGDGGGGGGGGRGDHSGDLAMIKRALQRDGVVMRLHRRLTSDLAGLAAANERDALEVGLHTLVGITELTLHRTTAMDVARTYWLTEEASYHAQRRWYGDRTDDVRWLLGFPTSARIAAALQWLKAQEVEALTFIGRVKSMMSSFPAIHLDAGGSASVRGSRRVRTATSLQDNPALVQYRRRVHWLLVYSKNFLLFCLSQEKGAASAGGGGDGADGGVGGIGVGGGGGAAAAEGRSGGAPEGELPSQASSPVGRGWGRAGRRASWVSSTDVLTQAGEALRYQRLVGAEDGPVHTLQQYRKPTWFERNRWTIALTALAGLQGVYILWSCSSYNGSTLLGDAVVKAHDTAATFVEEHLIEPVRNIVEYVIRRRRRSIAADPGAYDEARETLQRMLVDFVNDQGGSLSVNQRATLMAYAEACDLRAINSELQREVRSPLKSILGGQIVRLLLINAERMKLDMLLALNSMDELMRENTTTIEMMAMLPIVALGAASIFLARWVLGETSKGRFHRHRLRMLLQELERTVIRQSTHDLQLPGSGGGRAAHPVQARHGSHADLLAPGPGPLAAARFGGRQGGFAADGGVDTVYLRTPARDGPPPRWLWRSPTLEEEDEGGAGMGGVGGGGDGDGRRAYSPDAAATDDDDEEGDDGDNGAASFAARALDEAPPGTPQAYLAGDPKSRTTQRYFDLGQLIFAVWMIEHELRSHPDLLNRAKHYKVPLFSSLGVFFGAVGGVMVGGAGRSTAMGAASGGVVGYLAAHRMLEERRLITFDTERFLTDIHELPSPWLMAQQKVTWMSYLWRVYDLQRVLDPAS